jgi:integrase
VAIRTLATVEETLELLKRRAHKMPIDLSPSLQVEWILSGGKLDLKASRNGTAIGSPNANGAEKSDLLGEICQAYLACQVQKQDTTLASEKIHIKHLKRVLKARTPIRTINLDSLRGYHRRRARERHQNRYISDATIKKELVTFRQIWCWAQNDGRIHAPCPLLDSNGRWRIHFEKPAEREKFKTWAQIERRINRGGLSNDEVEELWRGLYLDQTQVNELLSYVKEAARYEFIYPMFAFPAYTGARRSEVIRSEIDDFDFEGDQVTIRERKRKKDKKQTTRLVPLHPKLRLIMEEWFERHPGGPYTIQCPKEMPRRKPLIEFTGLTVNQAHRHFEMTLQGSKWSVVTGCHVLRHSFGSNLIRSGKVPSEVVAKWMGHTTMEMRELYQHLFPQDGLNHISVLE